MLGLSDHANGAGSGGRSYTPSSWAPTAGTPPKDSSSISSSKKVLSTSHQNPKPTAAASSSPQQYPSAASPQHIRPIFLRQESRESLSAPTRNSSGGGRGGRTTRTSGGFYSGGYGGNDSASDLTSLYTIDQGSPGGGGGGGLSKGLYPSAATASPSPPSGTTGSRRHPHQNPHHHYPRPLYRHSHRQDSSDDGSSSGGVDSSYFGSAGSDFLMKRRRGQVTTTLVWIDVACQCLWTIAAGLTLESGDGGGWVWLWSNVSMPLTVLAGLRVMVLAFTVYFSHSNFNALVVLFCGASTLFMVYGINSAIQHRISMSLLLVGQYASSILVTQLYWVSYSVHTPLSAALEWEYDPLLNDSITFSRESRLYGATTGGTGNGGLARTPSFRRGTGYGAINYPIGPVAEQDEETGMGPDEFLKVDVTIRSQPHKNGAIATASAGAEGSKGSSGKGGKGGEGKGGYDNQEEEEEGGGAQESSDSEQEMAVLLAFQEARRQQVFAFSPGASSSALPSRSVLSSSKDSDLILRGSPYGGGGGPVSAAALSSYDRRMAAAEARIGSAGASRVLTLGHMARCRQSSRANPGGAGADAQCIGRRTWTAGRSIIFSGILVESSDEDDDDDDDNEGDAKDKEERWRKKQLARLGFGTLDSMSSLSVDGMVETVEVLEDSDGEDDEDGGDNVDDAGDGDIEDENDGDVEDENDGDVEDKDDDHLGESNTHVDEERHEATHGDLPLTDDVDANIKVEVKVAVSTDSEIIDGISESEIISEVVHDTLKKPQGPQSMTCHEEGGEVDVQAEVAIDVDEEMAITSEQQQDGIHIVAEGTDHLPSAQTGTPCVAENDIMIVTDVVHEDSDGGGVAEGSDIPLASTESDRAYIDVEGQVYVAVKESGDSDDPANLDIGHDQDGDGGPHAISVTKVLGTQETWVSRPRYGTAYEVLPVNETYEAVYDYSHHDSNVNDQQTHVHGHGSVHLDATIDIELDESIQEEVDAPVEGADVMPICESSGPTPYTESHADEAALVVEQEQRQHTVVDISVDAQVKAETSTAAPEHVAAPQVIADTTEAQEIQEVDIAVSMEVNVESEEHVLNDTTVAKDAYPPRDDGEAQPRRNKIKVRVYETRETAMVICDDPNCPDPDHHIDHDIEIDQSLVIGNVTSGRIVQLDVHEFQRASVERDGKEIEVDIDIDLKKELGLEGIPLLVSDKDGDKDGLITDSKEDRKEGSEDGGKSGGHKRMRLKELVETTMIEEETGSDPTTLDPTTIKVDIDVTIDDDGNEKPKLVIVGLDNQERPPGSHGSTVVHVNERVETITVEEECIDGDDHDKVSVILPGDIPVKDGESVTIIRRPSRRSPVVPGQPIVRPPGRWMVTTDTTLVRPPVRPPIPPAMVGPRPVMQRPFPGGFVRPIVPRPMVIAPRPLVAAPRPLVVAPRPMVAAPRKLVVPPRPLVAAPRMMVRAPRAVMVAPRPMMVRPRPILVRPPQRIIAPRPQAIIRPMLRPVPRPAPRISPGAPVTVARPQLRPVQQRPVSVIRPPPPRPVIALRPMVVRPPPVIAPVAPRAVVVAPAPVITAPAPMMAMPGPAMMAGPPPMMVAQPPGMVMPGPGMVMPGPGMVVDAPPMMAAGPRGAMVMSNGNMVSSGNRNVMSVQDSAGSGPGLPIWADGRGAMVQFGDPDERHGHLHATLAAAIIEENGHANRSSVHYTVNDGGLGDGFIRSTDVDPDLDRYVHLGDNHEEISQHHQSQEHFQQGEVVEQTRRYSQEIVVEDEEMEYLVQDLQPGVPPQLRDMSIETYYDTTKSQMHARERQPIPILGFQEALLATTTTTSMTTGAAVVATSEGLEPPRTVQTPPPVLSFPKPPSNPPPIKLLANRGAATAVAAAAAGVRGGVLKSESKSLPTDHPLHESPHEATHHHAPGVEPREERRTTFQLPPLPRPPTEDISSSSGGGSKRPISMARSLISQSILESSTMTTTGDLPPSPSLLSGATLTMPEVRLRPARTKDRKVKRPKSAMPMSRHHLHPSLLREAVMATWNNEFEAALTILDDYKDVYPRWSLAAAEVLIVQQLFSGQLSEPDDQLNEALQLSERVASKVLDKKQEFESNYMDYRSFCTADITLATTNESTLRQNYKWDCDMAFYHTLLYRGILQITSASDTKGAFSDIKGGLQLRRAWKGYQRIKQEMALAKEKWLKLKAYEATKDQQQDPLVAAAAGKATGVSTTTTTTLESQQTTKSQNLTEPVAIPSAGSKTPSRSQSAKTKKKPPPPSSSAKRASALSSSQPNEVSHSQSASTGSRWSMFGKRSSWSTLGANQGQGQDENEAPEEVVASSSPSYLTLGGGGMASALREQAKAAEDLRNAVEVLEDVEDTMTYGIGLFYFILSIVPKSFHPVLKTIGLQPDHEQGIQNLERVFERRNSQGQMIPTALNHITRGIQTCEASGIPSINYRFEMGLTFFIDQQFVKAADIFEILWRRYLTSQQNQALIGSGTATAQESAGRSAKGGAAVASKTLPPFMETAEGSNALLEEYEEDEFELAPFCGLCLIACKVVMRLGQADYFGFATAQGNGSASGGGAKDPQRRGSSQPKLTPLSMATAATSAGGYEFDLMAAAQEVLGMMMEASLEPTSTVKTNASTSQGAGGKGKLNKFNKFAWIQCRKALERGGVSPFLPLVILYLRRDVAYMKPSLLRKFHSLLESALKSVPQPPDADSQAIYLLLNGVIHRELLPDDPTIAYTSFTDCLLLDSLIENETWVIPYCHYELGELLYKRLHLVQEAKDQFTWILKGPGKGPRSSIYASTATNPRLSMMGLVGSGPFQDSSDPPIMGHTSQPSVASLASNPRFSQLFGTAIPTSPTAPSFQTPQALYLARYKKFEFSQSLRQRCVVAIEQLDKTLQQRQ
ncbi:hypothetical protein DFQ26_001527 [Actinomortierella ambigua]|nr:hypothetical protein DFQ26_001527 [Actinomortierella ambigua]